MARGELDRRKKSSLIGLFLKRMSLTSPEAFHENVR